MSKLLRDLLAAQEPLFTQSLRELEFATGRKGTDIRLTAELIERSNAAVRSLGLDVSDTADKELFHALNHRIGEHNKILANSLGLSDTTPVVEAMPKIVEALKAIKIPRKSWVLKKSIAKDLLRESPPKRLMKHLNYRSIESMFKNESFNEIYCAIRFSEGAEWLKNYNALFQTRVKATDFENRQIEIIVMDPKKWVDLADDFIHKKNHNITHAKELGVVAVVPVRQQNTKGLVLKTLPLLLHYISEVRLYSAFFKLKSTLPDFGRIMSQTLIADTGTGATIADFHVHWRVIQRYFGKGGQEPPEVFQPHVQPEDLPWRKTAELLYEINPEIKFWEDMEYIGRLADDGKPVSFNLFDATLTYSNNESYENRYVYHMRESLWNEIFIRYMGEPQVAQQILDQLDKEMVKPEDLL
jgi:hypothetical protein